MRSCLPPPRPDWALFLDVDGTLVDLADRPDAVRVAAGLPRRLARLAAALDGAVALISGRPLAELDALFAPLRLPSAGLHGLERRDATGRVRRSPIVVRADVREALAAFARSAPGLLLEDKGAAVALHWRGAPQLAADARAAIEAARDRLGDGWHVLDGACVYELKPDAVDKGAAVREFLASPPFAGRVPVYVGDDVTDADGIAAAEAACGIGIAVGTRLAARHRLADPADVAHWLAAVDEVLAAGAARTRDDGPGAGERCA